MDLMTKTFEEEQAELKKSIPELTYEITTLKARSDAADKFTKVIDSYTDIKELNADILNELIDKIVVHHKEKLYGKTYQQVEIYYRFVGELKETVAKAAKLSKLEKMIALKTVLGRGFKSLFQLDRKSPKIRQKQKKEHPVKGCSF